MKPKLVLVRAGIKALLNCDGVSAAVEQIAAQTAQRAGDGYAAAAPHKTGQRVAVNVYPATREAAIDNLENDTLLKAVYR